MKTSPKTRSRILGALQRVHRERSGFTLVEVLVSLGVAGMIGTSMYFVYRSQARIFFVQESVSQTQAELRFALETMKADVKRAGYLATLSTANDTFWCGARPTPDITAVQVQPNTGFVHNTAENINIEPDTLRILGSFGANNTLYTQGVNGTTITLSNDPVYSPGFPASQVDYERIFAPGTLLRLLDTANRYQIQRITASTYGAGGVNSTLNMQSINRSSQQGCGPLGVGQGLLVNPLDYVQYRIIDSSNSASPGTCGNSPALVGRTTLVRESLAPDGTTVTATLPIADYIVDLRTWFMVDQNPLGQQPAIALDTNPYDFVGNAPATFVNANPASTRSAGIFLAARTPAEDPSFAFRQRQKDPAGQVGYGPLTSFNLDTDRIGSARVRSLSTEVQLRNFVLTPR